MCLLYNHREGRIQPKRMGFSVRITVESKELITAQPQAETSRNELAHAGALGNMSVRGPSP